MTRTAFAIGMGVLVIACGCKQSAQGTVFVDSELRKFVGADTTVLAGAELNKLKATPFYARHRSLLDLPMVASLSERTGFDPRRDLSKVLVIWNGRDLLAAARGMFDKGRLERSLGPSRAPYRNHKLFSFGRDAVAVFSADVALGGDMRSLEAGLDTEGKATGEVPEALEWALPWLRKSDQVWLVSRGLPFGDARLRSDYASILANFAGYIETTAAGITADSGLHFRARVECVSEAGARRVDDAARAGIGLVKLSLKPDRADDARFYDAFRVRRDGRTVYIAADLPAELSDLLIRRFSKFEGTAGLPGGR